MVDRRVSALVRGVSDGPIQASASGTVDIAGTTDAAFGEVEMGRPP